MKEQGQEHSEWGFKVPQDGWHLVEFGEGIDLLKDKDGNAWQDTKSGNKAYKFPCKIKDDQDPDDGADVSPIAQIPRGGGTVANILAAVGLWAKFQEKFPGDNVSVFDENVFNAIKTKVPGTSCMVRTEQNKDHSRAGIKEMCSIAKYKELLRDGKIKPAGQQTTNPQTSAPQTGTQQGQQQGALPGTANDGW